MVNPSEHLINSIEEIAAIQDSLSLGDRSLTSARGLHVKTKGLATGELQYMAGGRLITKLVFIKEPDGTKSTGTVPHPKTGRRRPKGLATREDSGI